MKTIVRGYLYQLNNIESKDIQTIQFVHREQISNDSTILKTIQDGITNEEFLNVLIDRMKVLEEQLPCQENYIVIEKLKDALFWLEKRSEDRDKRNVKGKFLK